MSTMFRPSTSDGQHGPEITRKNRFKAIICLAKKFSNSEIKLLLNINFATNNCQKFKDSMEARKRHSSNINTDR